MTLNAESIIELNKGTRVMIPKMDMERLSWHDSYLRGVRAALYSMSPIPEDLIEHTTETINMIGVAVENKGV
jgi:hypothetical protein